MPSSSPRIPKLCRHKATGQWYVTLNGQEHYLSRSKAAAQTEYERLIAEWLQCGRQPLKPETRLTLNELILGYFRFAADYYRESEKEQEKIKLAMRPLKNLYGCSAAAEFGPKKLKIVREQMIDAGLSRRTINMRVGCIKRMARWAVESELVPATIHYGLLAVNGLRQGRSKARDPNPVKPVPEAFVEAVMPFVGRHVRGMITLQRLTGARPGEICRMRACDIDMTGEVWVFRPLKHKNLLRGHQREIYIGPKAQQIIREFLKPNTEAYLFSPRDRLRERYQEMRTRRESRVQPSQVCRKKKRPKKQVGEWYTTYSYRRAIRRACTKAKVPAWFPHQLRHSAATYLRKQFGVELARIILGHKTAFTTEIYAEADRQQAMDVVAKIG
jgi:integrase